MEELFKLAAEGRNKSSLGSVRDVLLELLREKRIIFMDGGFSNELVKVLGRPLNSDLWTAEVLINEEMMKKGEEVHQRYVSAGSDLILSTGYQASFEGFQKLGYSEEEAAIFLQRSVQICKRAKARISAASFGPYAASLADGSEYNPTYNTIESIPMLIKWHRKRLNEVMKASPDYLAFETIPCAAEVAAITSLLQEEVYPPTYISVSCSDGSSLNSGDSLLQTLRLLLKFDVNHRVRGLGVNCTEPDHISSNLKIINRSISEQSREIYVVCYPNSGKKWNGERKEWIVGSGTSAAEFAEMAKEWAELGVRVIGGCCETDCSTIAALKSVLDM